MYNSGDIVYHKNLSFSDNTLDSKKHRPCVVLFSLEVEEGTKVYICPLTKQVDTFNKHPNDYYFISEIVYNYSKLSFAKLNNVLVYDEKELHNTNIKLSNENIIKILEKVKAYVPEKKLQEKYKYVRQIIKYIEVFDKFDMNLTKTTRKQNRNQKIKQKKMNIIL